MPEQQTLEGVIFLINELRQLDEQIDSKETELKRLKAMKTLIEEETIPSLFVELGITELTLESGEKVVMKPIMYTALTDETKPFAYDWLEKNDYGGLIKTNVIVSYGKGKLKQAQDALAKLTERGFDATLKRDVHHQTLSSFLNESLREGRNVPLEVFQARATFKTTIK